MSKIVKDSDEDLFIPSEDYNKVREILTCFTREHPDSIWRLITEHKDYSLEEFDDNCDEMQRIFEKYFD